MNNFLIGFIEHGLIKLPWWGYVIVALALTHITVLTVTIFLHRCQAHRALTLHPVLSHFFRFWSWLTTSMITKEWVAVHRKHHAFSDKPGDPHSPQVVGIKKVLFEGVELYNEGCTNKEIIDKYGNGTPDDWLEKNIYTKHPNLGVAIMLAINLILFGPIGLSIWALQMMWIPITAAGIINGLGHYKGYRNFENSDHSTNIFPWGIIIGGEELHNNHHTFGTSAKLSYKWYEFDLGWCWIKLFSLLGLAKINKVIPLLKSNKIEKISPNYQTLETIILNRYHLVLNYVKDIKSDCKQEIVKVSKQLHEKISWNKLKIMLLKDYDMLTIEEQQLLLKLSMKSHVLNKIIALKEELSKVWQKSNLTRDDLLKKLQTWCSRAENCGIYKLRLFSLRLKSY